MGRNHFDVDVHFQGYDLLLTADDECGTGLEVWLYTGDLTKSDHVKIEVTEMVFDKLLVEFQEAHNTIDDMGMAKRQREYEEGA